MILILLTLFPSVGPFRLWEEMNQSLSPPRYPQDCLHFLFFCREVLWSTFLGPTTFSSPLRVEIAATHFVFDSCFPFFESEEDLFPPPPLFSSWRRNPPSPLGKPSFIPRLRDVSFFLSSDSFLPPLFSGFPYRNRLPLPLYPSGPAMVNMFWWILFGDLPPSRRAKMFKAFLLGRANTFLPPDPEKIVHPSRVCKTASSQRWPSSMWTPLVLPK